MSELLGKSNKQYLTYDVMGKMQNAFFAVDDVNALCVGIIAHAERPRNRSGELPENRKGDGGQWNNNEK